MRTRASLLGVLTLAVAMVGCGDSSTSSTATSPPSTTSAVTTTTSVEQLKAQLLTVADVGPGWQLGHVLNPADYSDATKAPCDAALDTAVATRLTPVTGVQFEPTDSSYKHLIEFLVTGAPDQLASDLQAFAGALLSCSGKVPTGTEVGTMTVENLTIPELGDQRAAYVIVGRESASSELTWYGRNAQVRVGSVAIEIGLTEILSTPQTKPTISDAEFVKLVQTAAAKLAA